MKAKDRSFRIPAKFANFSSQLFSRALRDWFAEPPASVGVLREYATDEAVVQKKIPLEAEDVDLMQKLKDFYKIEHDYELVTLVIANATANNVCYRSSVA